MPSKPDASLPESGADFSWKLALFGGVLWLSAMSAPLVESDLYRYAVVILVGIGLKAHLTAVPRLRFGWLAWLCIGWGAYVVLRFAATYLLVPGNPIGTSEWLYAFPLFFPALGVALYVFRSQIERILAAFFAAALVMLLATTDYAVILSGGAASPLIQHNQIHGAVGCGMLVVGAFYWLLHYVAAGDRSSLFARFAMVVAPLVIALALFAIYGAKSKGVWLAMIVVLPVMLLSLPLYLRRRDAIVVIAALAVMSGLAVLLARDNLVAVAGPTFLSAAVLVEKVTETGTVAGNLTAAIASGHVPESMNERLKLWFNASEIIAANPLFGAGSLWLDAWSRTTYSGVAFNLIHNGYLEILIRHGVFGLAVFAVMALAFVRSVYMAWRANLVGLSALLCHCVLLLFFMLTLASNSNNRLAIGESFSLLFAAVAFFCYELRRRLPLGQGLGSRIETA